MRRLRALWHCLLAKHPPRAQPARSAAPPLCEWEDLELCPIAGGEFQMGSGSGRDDEAPIHAVRLDEYYLARFPVTNAQYRLFVEDAGHREPSYCGDHHFNEPGQPVVGVSWHDASAFCRWLAAKTGQPYHLPTEAEWERAARGSAGRTYPWGEQMPDASRCNTEKQVGRPTSAGRYLLGVSPYGCEDMAGNVCEWCQDWYGPYPSEPQVGPRGPAGGDYRVLRGGSWYFFAHCCRTAFRFCAPPDQTYCCYGFRVARPA